MFHVYSVDPSPLFCHYVRRVRVLCIRGEPVQRVHPPPPPFVQSCSTIHYCSGRWEERRSSQQRSVGIHCCVIIWFRFWGKTIKGTCSLSLFAYIENIHTCIDIKCVNQELQGILFRCQKLWAAQAWALVRFCISGPTYRFSFTFLCIRQYIVLLFSFHYIYHIVIGSFLCFSISSSDLFSPYVISN